MKIIKPEWIAENVPLITCDIHPDGSRFAVGGNSNTTGGGKIQIWNMDPVLDPIKEKDDKVPKLLCAMFNHMACVNCVRWTISGKYLASGADDRLVMVWTYGGKTIKDGLESENWKCIHRLQGHEADVIDLAWNRNDKYLATSSLDNTVIIWNSKDKFNKLQVLRGHTNFVKGVAWDPVGSYLASQGVDNSVRIWNTVDWKEETKITEPFTDPNNGHVMRISWSPDGTYLIAGSAVNNGGPTAQVISRKWKTGFDLVGHRKSVSCVRFSPTCRRTPDGNRSDIDSSADRTPCCAIGSRDRSISVWLTSLKRPLVVVHDLFEDSILDLSWDSKGLILMATSWDGSIAVLQFRKDEVGEQLSFSEMSKLLESHYGSSADDIGEIVIENPAIMNMKQNEVVKPEHEIKRGPEKQIIGTRKDGKKRITPAFIGGLAASTPKPFGSKEFSFTSIDSKDKEAMEVDDDGKDVNPPEKPSDPSTPISTVENSDVKKPKLPQAKDFSRLFHTENMDSETKKKPDKDKSLPTKPKETVEVNLGFNKAPVAIIETDLSVADNKNLKKNKTSKRSRPTDEREEVKLSGSELSKPKHQKVDHDLNGVKQNPTCIQPDELVKRDNSGGVDRMIPNFVTPLKLPIDSINLKIESYQLYYEVEETASLIYKKNAHSKNERIWQSIFDSKLVAIEIHGGNAYIGLECGEMNIISLESGKRVAVSEFVGVLSEFQIVGDLLLIVTTHGDVQVRNVSTVKTVAVCSMKPFTTNNTKVHKMWLSAKNGIFHVSTDNGAMYCWNTDLLRWNVIHKSNSFIYSVSDGNNMEITEHIKKQPPSTNAYPSAKTVGEYMAAGMEERLNQALVYNDVSGFRRNILQYVRHLVTHQMESRLKELCDDLLGPVHSSENDWCDEILSIKKRTLLREMLPILGSNLRLQRMYAEYEEMLELIQSNQ